MDSFQRDEIKQRLAKKRSESAYVDRRVLWQYLAPHSCTLQSAM